MSGYSKLFEVILDSTIWAEDDATRIVWITMLAMRNERHMVEASLPGLAYRARVPLEKTIAAVEKLKSPDPYSRSKEHEGRRVQEVDGGWLILNGEKYRKKMSKEDRREYQREKQAEYREKRRLESGENLTQEEIQESKEYGQAHEAHLLKRDNPTPPEGGEG